MNENPYNQLIQQLKNGELQEIVVEKEDFLIFRECWLQEEARTKIVGEAGLNGKIIYRFQSEAL